MNRLLTILLLLGATAAHGQINNPPTSVNIVDATATGRAVLTATNAAAAQVAIFGTNVSIKNSVGLEGISLSDGQTKLLGAISFPYVGGSTTAATTRTNLGGTTVGNALFTAATDNAARVALGATLVGANIFTVPIQYQELYLRINADNTVSSLSPAAVRTNLGLGATNNVTFSNITASGTLGVSNAATFATNVTVNGNISVGSLTTTTPSTWALDATQTAAATNGVLTLPSNANVIRLTNNTAISGVTNGVLGAFYYLVNQTTNAVTISNVGGITIQGGTPLTLGANQAATLVATGATNASVAARGDLTDVALGGTANTAPSQTASSGSSLMTRSLSDVRYLPSFGEYMDGTYYRQTMADWMPTRVTNGGSVNFETTGSRWQLVVLTNTGCVTGVRIGRLEPSHSLAAGGNSTWSSGFTAFVYLSAWSRANQVLRFVVGRSLDDPIGEYPTNRAVGIEFSGDGDLSARLIAHNGTTATNGPLITGLRGAPYGAFDLYAVRYYPNGTVELYRSISRGAFTNIPAATITGGPTNNAAGISHGAVDVAYDNGTNAASGGAVTSIHWWGYQYHD